METFESRTFAEPDETRSMEQTTIGSSISPGGRSSEPRSSRGGPKRSARRRTDRCQVEHVAYVVSGRLHAEHDDGSAGEVGAGEVFRLAPGPDAWVVGDEPVVLIEFQEMWERAGG